MKVSGNIVDALNREIYSGTIFMHDGVIEKIERGAATSENFILPGFTDSHIHIESSMLVPYEFARIALAHGTVATVSDPHEIANVCGIAGVDYMIENAKGAKLKFNFGAPSCVPATSFESAIQGRAAGVLVSQQNGSTNQIALALKTVANPSLTFVIPVYELVSIKNSTNFMMAAGIMLQSQDTYEIFNTLPQKK